MSAKMKPKFDILDLIVAIAISFTVGCFVGIAFFSPVGVGFSPGPAPATLSQGFSSPSSEASERVGLGAGPESGETPFETARNFPDYDSMITHPLYGTYPAHVEYEEGMTLMPHQTARIVIDLDAGLGADPESGESLPGYLNRIYQRETFYAPAIPKVTAYCPCEICCGGWSDGFTASGHKIKYGDRFIAADRNIPFNTMMVVLGYNDNNPVPVLDRGRAIKENRIDVFFNTHQEALEWGVRWLKVEMAK